MRAPGTCRQEREALYAWSAGILIAASMRLASSHDSPPIGWPAAKSSSVGASASNITAAFSGPCGRMRRAVPDDNGSWVLLASQSWSAASVSCDGGATLGSFDDGSVVRACVRGKGGFSQLRG